MEGNVRRLILVIIREFPCRNWRKNREYLRHDSRLSDQYSKRRFPHFEAKCAKIWTSKLISVGVNFVLIVPYIVIRSTCD
jgi:hypothetical protein